ncbi:stabilizer of axonemal microtubules 2 [Megalops cyprinoides]|uniref:stabilizer of axonemal microtubules 2 n=1 Tax=Megalops cyprinoides TaxID=118141 RepID=UPI001863CEA3|nr:stabilizer of axonemal microtubules 2 [Megalops cyprinoides]
MKRLCICEICNCGRHRCAHRPTALYKKDNNACVVTEYKEKYPTYGGYNPPTSLKPKQEHQKDRGKMDGTTTFRSDYIPYEVSRRPARQQAEYKPNTGEIDLETTYKLDFNPHEVQPFAPARPKEKVHTKGGKLDTLPTYKEDFRPWEINKRELTRPEYSYQPPTEKFGNSTTFQEDFVPRGLVPRESFKPPNMAKLSEAPFDSATTNRQAFVPHALEARFIKAKEEYKPSSQPFQDRTTHRTDFQGLPGQLPKSCKPDFGKVASDVPFQNSTEFRDRFQQWPVSLPQVRQLVEYVGPTVPMDMSTTSQGDFIKHEVQPFVSVRPLPRPTKSSAPFQGNTTMRDDFKPWASRRQEMIKRPEEMRKASGKIDHLTTFKAHYTQHDVQPSVSFKPAQAPLRSEAPFDDGTMYRADFTPKRVSMCPASFDSPPGYVFENSDERGHRFFRKLLSQDRNKMAVASNIQSPREVAVMS